MHGGGHSQKFNNVKFGFVNDLLREFCSTLYTSLNTFKIIESFVSYAFIEMSILQFCKEKSSGIYFNHPENCNKYIVCANSISYEMNCPSGLYFDDDTNVCSYKNQVFCEKGEFVN